MSERPSSRLSWLARMGLVTASLVGSLSIGGGSFAAVAQEASPDASPAAECVPGEMSVATPEASPAADMASPVAAEEPVGTPADEATTAAATEFIENVKACVDDPDALATLVTPNLVQTLGGYASVEEALADDFFTELPFAQMEIQKVTSYDNGAVGVTVQYMQSEYQLVAEEWWLVQVDGAWKLDAIENETAKVDGDQVAVGVNLVENEDGTYSATPNSTSAPVTDVIIFQAINADGNTEPHELVVVQLPEGADPAGLFDDSIPEEDITFIGFVFVPNPGDRADMSLVGLPEGVYTLLCFIPAPDGKSHAEHGMITTFEVTAPAE